MANDQELTEDRVRTMIWGSPAGPSGVGKEQEPQQPASVQRQTSASGPPVGAELQKLSERPEPPKIGFGEDIARSAGAGFGQGVIGLAALPGTVETLYNMGREKLTGQKPSEQFFPTASDIAGKVKEYAPELQKHLEYEPQYKGLPQYAKTAAEFLPSAIIPGGGLSLGARAAGSIGAGVATQATENYLKGTPTEGTDTEVIAKLAASVPGFILGRKIMTTGQNLAGGTVRAGAEAERRIASELGKDVAAGGKYGAPMSPSAALETGVDVAPAALAGQRGNKLLQEAASRVSPEAAGAYEASVAPLRQEAPGRMKQYVNELLGIENETSPFETIAAIRSRGRQLNDENYTRVMALPHAQDVRSPALDQVASQLPRGVIDEVRDNLRQRGINPGENSLRFWDEVKQNLDQRINSLKDPLTGRVAATQDYGILNNTNSMLKSALDNRVREYPIIRGAAAESAGAANAVELGMKYLQTTDPRRLNFIETTRNRLTAAQQADFATGVVGSYKQLLDTNPNAAMQLFSGSKGGDRIRRLNEALSPLGNNLGNELVGRATAELLNTRIAALRPSSGVDVRRLFPYLGAAPGAIAELAELFGQQALWSGSPLAIPTAVAGIAGGKLYNWKEARVANKVLEYMSDPSKMAQLGKLIEQDAAARSFVGKTYNMFTRAVAPGVASDDQRTERASGGRISSGAIAQRLVAAAEKAHKYHQKTTEEILDAPDEAVVKALAVAKKNI